MALGSQQWALSEHGAELSVAKLLVQRWRLTYSAEHVAGLSSRHRAWRLTLSAEHCAGLSVSIVLGSQLQSSWRRAWRLALSAEPGTWLSALGSLRWALSGHGAGLSLSVAKLLAQSYSMIALMDISRVWIVTNKH